MLQKIVKRGMYGGFLVTLAVSLSGCAVGAIVPFISSLSQFLSVVGNAVGGKTGEKMTKLSEKTRKITDVAGIAIESGQDLLERSADLTESDRPQKPVFASGDDPDEAPVISTKPPVVQTTVPADETDESNVVGDVVEGVIEGGRELSDTLSSFLPWNTPTSPESTSTAATAKSSGKTETASTAKATTDSSGKIDWNWGNLDPNQYDKEAAADTSDASTAPPKKTPPKKTPPTKVPPAKDKPTKPAATPEPAKTDPLDKPLVVTQKPPQTAPAAPSSGENTVAMTFPDGTYSIPKSLEKGFQQAKENGFSLKRRREGEMSIMRGGRVVDILPAPPENQMTTENWEQVLERIRTMPVIKNPGEPTAPTTQPPPTAPAQTAVAPTTEGGKVHLGDDIITIENLTPESSERLKKLELTEAQAAFIKKANQQGYFIKDVAGQTHRAPVQIYGPYRERIGELPVGQEGGIDAMIELIKEDQRKRK